MTRHGLAILLHRCGMSRARVAAELGTTPEQIEAWQVEHDLPDGRAVRTLLAALHWSLPRPPLPRKPPRTTTDYEVQVTWLIQQHPDWRQREIAAALGNDDEQLRGKLKRRGTSWAEVWEAATGQPFCRRYGRKSTAGEAGAAE